MSDWKSHYGVSDEGASNAGVYGTPTSTWQIAHAQQETQKLDAARRAELLGSTPTYTYTPPTYVPPFGTQPTYPGAAVGSYAPASGGGFFKGLLKLMLVLGGLYLLAAMFFPLALSGLLLFSNERPGNARTLDTAYYQSLSAQARTLSGTPTSRLYATHLSKAKPQWAKLSPRQKDAVAAAWIRYTRDPASFSRLPSTQKAFVFAAFDSYLQALSAKGDAHAKRDLARLRSSNH